jgi:phosphatidylserine/phosphatidylglycerophosphate/cardiolipin synthase-like enzyme
MDSIPTTIEAVARLAVGVPVDVLERVAQVVSASETTELRSRVAEVIPHPNHRSLCQRFVNEWLSSPSPVSGLEVAMSLRTAAHLGRLRDRSQSIELAWTGPRSQPVSHRHTEQAILQVLDSARVRITLVCYAVYRIPHVRDALVRAARRGVRVVIIVETPDRMQGQHEYDTIRALGEDVAACSTLYFWPKDRRERDPNGKVGILHVKCVVADGRWLFLSSANLTEYAFSINMELGVLITGGEPPRLVEQQFQQLIGAGLLEEVKSGE